MWIKYNCCLTSMNWFLIEWKKCKNNLLIFMFHILMMIFWYILVQTRHYICYFLLFFYSITIILILKYSILCLIIECTNIFLMQKSTPPYPGKIQISPKTSFRYAPPSPSIIVVVISLKPRSVAILYLTLSSGRSVKSFFMFCISWLEWLSLDLYLKCS